MLGPAWVHSESAQGPAWGWCSDAGRCRRSRGHVGGCVGGTHSAPGGACSACFGELLRGFRETVSAAAPGR